MLHRIILLLLILCSINATARAAVIQLPQTGQTKCYDAAGIEITPCTGTGQDGDKLAGAAWPNPRFTDNSNGTVTDNLTGLIWLMNANCFNTQTWPDALTSSNTLASGACGLDDGSVAGDWRLPNIVELKSLVDLSSSTPGTPALPKVNPFISVQLSPYWSSTTAASFKNTAAWSVDMDDGYVDFELLNNRKNDIYFVWPVRGGQ